mmetsp:Transcript_6350/g.8838  ORF Transcript_6350/g.8838 Transcript_6350/m.8838 type:complete len:84 (-) Transcript_6350:60-311(-)
MKPLVRGVRGGVQTGEAQALIGCQREREIYLFVAILVVSRYCDADLLINMLSDKLTIPMNKDDFMLVLQRQTNFEWEAYNLRM